MRVPGARFDGGPSHEAAMDWAADLARGVDRLDRPTILEAWNGEAGKAHREQLKASAPGVLLQLVGYVRARLAALEPPKPQPPDDFAVT